MAVGGLTRADLEARAIALAEALSQTMARVEELRDRLAAEAAAGTLDGADFYPVADPGAQEDKANVMGFCDDMHNLWAGRAGYIKALIGVLCAPG
jgi:hypothetical protein